MSRYIFPLLFVALVGFGGILIVAGQNDDERTCALRAVAPNSFLIRTAEGSYCTSEDSGKVIQAYMAHHPDLEVSSISMAPFQLVSAVVFKHRDHVL